MTDTNIPDQSTTGSKAKRMNQYLVLKTIGKGIFKVKLVYDPASKTQYAAKVCRQKLRKSSLVDEVFHLQNLNTLSHPNIIKFIEFIEAEEPSLKNPCLLMSKPQNKEYQHKASLIMELAPNGSIFEVLFNTGPFEEKLARTYFKQLVNAVITLHKEGYVHRDIKPENLLLDENFQLKVGDFGLCERFDPKVGDNMTKKVGTEVYAPPELYDCQDYAGTKLDMFALGVTLFLFVVGSPPFFKATASDAYYKQIIQGNSEKFWQAFETKLRRKEGFDQGLKTLINDLLASQPLSRPKAEALLEYQWMKGDVYLNDELIQEMKGKKNIKRK